MIHALRNYCSLIRTPQRPLQESAMYGYTIQLILSFVFHRSKRFKSSIDRDPGIPPSNDSYMDMLVCMEMLLLLKSLLLLPAPEGSLSALTAPQCSEKVFATSG